ncbi:MAG TPA: GGDEF domain-containing protein, partial [Firmicutes bacterium]|nr:GGDEF domain-containing protein [Bacillota bacterium]
DGKVTWYVKPLKHTDFYFVASAPDRIIYNPLHSTLARVTFTLPVFIFFVIIVINNYAFGSIGKLAKKLEERKNWYKQAALTDQLTGVFSRRHFNEIFEQYLNGTVPVQAPLAIAMTDVNNFKHINDTYGHLTGDEVLREIACVLKTHVRSEDKVIRYGGDEFLLLLKDCTLETAEKVLSRVNKTLQANSKFNFPIEISYGISIIRGKEELPQAIQAADARMYKMKEKNKVQDNTTFDLLPPVPLKQPF